MTLDVVPPPQSTRVPLVPRRRRRWPWVAVAVVLVVGGAVAVLHSPWLSVRSITVTGAERVDVDARLTAAGIGEGAILLWLDTAEVEAAIAADPWVRDVRARVRLPDRLEIDLIERVPALWVEGFEGWLLVAEDGTVVATAPSPARGLLRARLAFPDIPVGAAPDDASWREVVAMARVLPPALAARIELSFVGTELWTEVDGHLIRLGHPVDLADKAAALEAMLAEEIPAGWTIDLIAPRRPAVVDPSSTVEPGESQAQGPAEGDDG